MKGSADEDAPYSGSRCTCGGGKRLTILWIATIGPYRAMTVSGPTMHAGDGPAGWSWPPFRLCDSRPQAPRQ